MPLFRWRSTGKPCGVGGRILSVGQGVPTGTIDPNVSISINPATGKEVARYPYRDGEQQEEIIAAASSAFEVGERIQSRCEPECYPNGRCLAGTR